MSTIFTMPGKTGDSVLQFPVIHHWHKQTGEKCEIWMDEKTCKPLVNLFAAQPAVESVKLVEGVENYNCGGQPFHMNLPTSAYSGNNIYHLGFRAFPIRQISLQTLNDAKVPVTVDPETFANEPYLTVGEVVKVNRLVLHGQGICPHNRQTPTFWRFLASIRDEVNDTYDEVTFVGSPDDLEVAKETYPDWNTYSDDGDFLVLARFIAASRAMIGCGSSPITIAGALKVPAVRVHDMIGNDAPRVIWDNGGENQLNDTHVGLRTSYPEWRDRFILGVSTGKA